MSFQKFRLNKPKSYSDRMTDTRAEVRALVKHKLREITGQPGAQMKWAQTAYMRDVVSRYRVRIEGWPVAEIEFKNLSNIPNLRKLELLLRGWKDETIYFRQINEEEYQAMVADPTPWFGPLEDVGEGQNEGQHEGQQEGPSEQS
ncbi:hypothetical protein BC628DRAFT_565048 [Trametes gibbosa]|nr:hypothetical protein BC628DRAFT_565048 [Trametes gibbosa]